jgi:succinate dehydrogenase flavin-adding protein (antitoxin of CptAB toxin-antitoxin module)
MLNIIKRNFCRDLTAKIILNEDITIAKKQIFWRLRNMGQLELEIILMRWWEENKNQMSMNELEEFSKEVLEKEIPELNLYFINFQPAPDDLKYISTIQKQILL